jgi:hypothetical protein
MIESEHLGLNLKQTRGMFETAEMHERSLPIQRHRLDHIAGRDISEVHVWKQKSKLRMVGVRLCAGLAASRLILRVAMIG